MTLFIKAISSNFSLETTVYLKKVTEWLNVVTWDEQLYLKSFVIVFDVPFTSDWLRVKFRPVWWWYQLASNCGCRVETTYGWNAICL